MTIQPSAFCLITCPGAVSEFASMRRLNLQLRRFIYNKFNIFKISLFSGKFNSLGYIKQSICPYVTDKSENFTFESQNV